MDQYLINRLKQLLKIKAPGQKLKNRLLVSLILLSSIPVAIMAIASSYISYSIISNQTDQMHQVLLNQVEKEMNNQFKKFDELMLQYTYDNVALSRFTEEDLNYEKFQLVNDLYTVLTNLRSGMENVVEIDFYSVPYGKIVTSGGLLLQKDEFLDDEAIQKSQTLTKYGTWIDTRLSINARLNQPAITYIRPTSTAGTNVVKGFFIVYLNAASLSSRLKANTSDPATYLVANSAGNAVMYSVPGKVGSPLHSPELMKKLAEGRNVVNYRFTMELEGKSSLINAVYSDNRDWYYVSILPVALVAKQTHHLRNILLGVSVAFILIAILISIRTTSRIYEPVQKLTQRIFKNRDEVKTQDEIHSITEYIRNVEEQSDTLQRSLDQYHTHAEQYSLMSLILGNSKDMDMHPASFQNQRINLFLIEIDHLYVESQYSRNDQFLFYYAVENIANEIWSKQGSSKILMIQPGLFIMLHQPEQDGFTPQSSRIYADKLLFAIRAYLKLSCVISISYSESGLHGIHDAFLQAKQALRYSFTLGSNQVIISDELDPSVSNQADAIVEMEESILSSLQSTNYNEASECFLQLIQLLKEDGSLSFDALKAYFSQLLGVMVHSIKKQDGALAEFFSLKPLAIELENQRNLREIIAFFQKRFFEPLNAPRPETLSLEQQQIDEVVAYIRTHYDQDISLQLCAELVHLSSSQLSRSFKKMMGINFVDYVIQYRVSIAKEMLLDPHNSIQSVTDKLRYTSVNSFIRIFKKITGTTPGLYRKDALEHR